ncbi:unnamed protein product [Rhodiola kirilowii]
MTSCRKLEVKAEERNLHEWAVPLREEVFNRFMCDGGSVIREIFGDGSLFSPLLFGKFFDPSDAFPLWDFESDVLLANLRCSGKNKVDWLQTEHEYFLRADLPAGIVKSYGVNVCIEVGKVLEISGLWKVQKEGKTNDWRSGHWWDHGYVRRLELPENAHWRGLDACLRDEAYLEIRIPRYKLDDGAGGSN